MRAQRWAEKTKDPRSLALSCAVNGAGRRACARSPARSARPRPAGGARRWPSLTVLPWPAVCGERGGGAGQEEGGGEHDGGNPEAVQDADAVAEETNHWRPGEKG